MSLIVVFHNDSTGDEQYGNYEVTVYLNELPLYHGRVEKHDRRDGWEQLLRDFTNDLDKDQRCGNCGCIGRFHEHS